MNTFATVFASVLVAGLLYQTAGASPIEQPSISKECIADLASTFANYPIPEHVQKLEKYVRDLNPQKSHLSLTLLLDDKTTARNIVEAGFPVEKETVGLECEEYVDSLVTKMGASECGRNLLEISEDDQEEFTRIVVTEPSLDRVIGYARVCQ